MTKEVISDKDQIKSIVSKTLDKMATIVQATYGPGGRPVLIEREERAPTISKDGLTVARALGESSATANIIVDTAKEICINTAREAGDGTTTAIILANAIVKAGNEYLETQQYKNPQRLIRELHEAYDKVIVPYLKDNAIYLEDEEDLINVARLSANDDHEIASAAVSAVMSAGDDGKVLISEGQSRETTVDNVEGYVIVSGLKDLGQIGPAFINDKASQKVVMENGRVLLYDGKLMDKQIPAHIQNALTDVSGSSDGRPLVVLAHDFADNILDMFAKHTKGGQTILPVKIPRTGLPNGATIFLQDMAAYTDATIFDVTNIASIHEEDFGEFAEASSTMYETFIISDYESEQVEERVAELKAILDSVYGEQDKHHLRAHIAKLTGGVSTIVVGGTSDLEIREKRDRVEDAVEAVRSAIAEGIVPGGCSMHIFFAKMLKSHQDYKPSWEILINALLYPITVLLDNAGADEDVSIKLYDKISLSTPLPKTVYDVAKYNFVSTDDSNIIEPAKVCRISLGNALSVAALLMTAGGIIVAPKNEDMEMQMKMADRAFASMMEQAND